MTELRLKTFHETELKADLLFKKLSTKLSYYSSS